MAAIRRRKIYEEVARRLEQRIRDEPIVPGEQLPSERELMREFDVGRPAVREALFHLQKMGLVELRAGERARITRPTPKLVVESLSGAAGYLLADPNGVRHFQEARAFFEIGLGRHAAMHATPDDLQELRAALEANRDAIGNLRRFEETDVTFHYNLAVIPRNPIYIAIHAAIVEWLVEQRRITLATPGQSEIAYQAHAEICDAIARRDPDLAERVIRSHLDQVSQAYWRATGAPA
jgi:GntR family transcriptional repressor for pyruvate dehydrogenase complex